MKIARRWLSEGWTRQRISYIRGVHADPRPALRRTNVSSDIGLHVVACGSAACLATIALASGALRTPATPHSLSERQLAQELLGGPGLANHPVGVVPSGNVHVPDHWPLDTSGAIGCLTCHRALPSLDGTQDPLLRDLETGMVGAREFCTNCHGGQSTGSAAAVHWLALGRAHIGTSTDETTALAAAAGLDPASKRCLGCHDGVMAHDAAVAGAPDRPTWLLGDPSRSHPVGVRYTRSARSTTNPRLRPTTMLPAQIRLPGGNVSCVSCHDLYAGTKHLLVMPNKGSALCLTCHAMD